MTQNGSLENAGHPEFDLDTQKGVTHLLASVRAGDIPSDQKNELRDLIFLYSNGGKDQSVRINLEQKLTAYGIQPLQIEVETPIESEVSVPSFGTSRPAPSFSAPAEEKINEAPVSPPVSSDVSEQITELKSPAKPAVIEVTAEPVVKPEPVVKDEVEAPKPISKPVAEVAVIPVSKVEVPTKIPEPLTETAPKLVVETEPSETPESIPVPVSEPVIKEMVTPKPASIPAPESSPYDPGVNLQRIREIKALVNDRVGNPVNLVDINNEVGREYMAALLDAMKGLSNGTTSISPMARLEEAFKLVNKTLSEHDAKTETESQTAVEQTKEPEPVPEVTPKPKSIVESSAAKEVSEPVAKLPTIPKPDTSSTDAVELPPNIELNKVEVDVASGKKTVPKANTESEQLPSQPVPTPPPSDMVKKSEAKLDAIPSGAPAKMPPRHKESVIKSAWGPATDTLQAEHAKDVSKPEKTKTTSLAQSDTKLRTPNELPLASSLETSSVAGDPLFTKQVDTGMDQLLTEWSLFKKSGLFGTGPKGREHPLFKKISEIQIPLLLAGRFEGATQEIKQSITDYMNGWRYEQGIVYEQGETFEHYLRRVIRHILDLQK